MKKYYTIGEISKIYGISVHSIRHYHKMGLIAPSYIDEDSGYRYYSFERFQYFSRLKYLRSLGLSLDQIKEVFDSGDKDLFIGILGEIRAEKEKEIASIQKTISRIDWIEGYYSFFDNDYLNHIVYKNHFDERYIFQYFCKEEDSLEDIDVNLHRKINMPKNRNLEYLRQFGYVLDYEKLLEGDFRAESGTILLNEKPNLGTYDIKVLPAGYYLCYCTHILGESFDISPLRDYIEKSGLGSPRHVVAFEYEDNLKEFYNAAYEIQILF
jgi:DNA-binding transcriptional MerR regulator